jgi:hypothetical protein
VPTRRQPGSSPRRPRAAGSGAQRGRDPRQPIDVEHFIALPSDPLQIARQLFVWLRELDARRVEYVLIESVSRTGVGRAIMDRLERAASRVRRPERAQAPLEGA